MTTKIENVRLWTGEKEYPRGCLIIENGRVRYAGDSDGAPKELRADRAIDGRGGMLIPAFYNAHCHAAMVLMRGAGSDRPLMDWLGVVNPIEDRLDDEAVYAGSMVACMEMLRRGCVCFNDMYMFMDATAAAVRDSGIRALLGRGIVAEDRLEENIRLFEDWDGKADGRIHVAIAPYAEYGVTEELFRKCVDEAERLGASLHTHASETAGEVQACRERHGGRSPIRLMDDCGLFDRHCVAAHCVHVDDEEIALLARKGVYVAHNPASNMKLGSGIAPIEKMRRAGVRLCLGTDGAASNNGLDMIADMRLMTLLQKGALQDATAMDAETSLAIATRGGALACGIEDAGLLKEGFLADCVLLRAEDENLWPVYDVPSAVVYAAQGLNTEWTMVGGEIVYRDGEFPLFDAEEILRQARAASQRLLQA